MATTTYIDALEGAYYKALNGKVLLNGVAVPVYRSFVDIQKSDTYYILIQNPSSVGAESKCDTDQDASIQIVIYCRGAKISTANLRLMSAQVYDLVYPDRNFRLPVDEYQNINNQLVSDNVTSYMDTTATVQILERIIIFKHQLS